MSHPKNSIFYFDIILFPQGVSLAILRNKIFKQIHYMLTTYKNKYNLYDIGVTFPNYDEETNKLGNTIQIFSHSKQSLDKLDINKAFGFFTNYIWISNVKEKNSIKYVFGRRQFKINVFALVRRCMKRHNISYSEALDKYSDFKPPETKLSYIVLDSDTSKQKYKMFIERKEYNENYNFNTYGLIMK